MYPITFIHEKDLRKEKIISAMNGADAVLLCDNSNLFYTSSRVFSGYTYITADGQEIFFVKRPIGLNGENVIYIRKPEQIAEQLEILGIPTPKKLGLELATLSVTDFNRLEKIFPQAEIVNASAMLSEARAIKTPYEVAQLRQSGILHTKSYANIPTHFSPGMSDYELQIEIERELRRNGCIGQFRICGPSMEIFMGNLICGDNADNPTPYDFAMGGAGMHPSLPVGCNGTIIQSGMTVMVDLCGNFTGYMTDMTRVFNHGPISPLATKCHKCSIDICNHLAEIGKPGVEAKHLYNEALRIATEAGLEDYFMGHNQKAGFVGHGVGIEVNELPVLAPRSKHILQEGNVIAIEPKFVIPHIGAAGIENTYVVRANGMEKLTEAPEEIISLS